ncbi:MAG TPA: hypothetical protein VLE89_03230, partial [Chlamydiales bacterium]|nr:hypothetical protein [Chlamydiales bacterium]
CPLKFDGGQLYFPIGDNLYPLGQANSFAISPLENDRFGLIFYDLQGGCKRRIMHFGVMGESVDKTSEWVSKFFRQSESKIRLEVTASKPFEKNVVLIECATEKAKNLFIQFCAPHFFPKYQITANELSIELTPENPDMNTAQVLEQFLNRVVLDSQIAPDPLPLYLFHPEGVLDAKGKHMKTGSKVFSPNLNLPAVEDHQTLVDFLIMLPQFAEDYCTHFPEDRPLIEPILLFSRYLVEKPSCPTLLEIKMLYQIIHCILRQRQILNGGEFGQFITNSLDKLPRLLDDSEEGGSL